MDKVGICNEALQFAGAQPITSLDDDNVGAELCKNLWSGVRDEALEERAWTFATKRVTLTRENAEPAYGFSYQYLIPSTVLRVLEATDGDGYEVEWRLEDRRVVCDIENGLCVRAIFQVEETARWSPKFTQAVAYLLASKICIALNENRSLHADLVALYQNTLKQAASLDGLQGRSDILRGPTRIQASRY